LNKDFFDGVVLHRTIITSYIRLRHLAATQ
jgi:hypothetical protein